MTALSILIVVGLAWATYDMLTPAIYTVRNWALIRPHFAGLSIVVFGYALSLVVLAAFVIFIVHGLFF